MLKIVNKFLKDHRKELNLKGYSKMTYLQKLNYLKEKTKGTKYEREIGKLTKPRVDEGIKKILDKSGRGQNVRVKRVPVKKPVKKPVSSKFKIVEPDFPEKFKSYKIKSKITKGNAKVIAKYLFDGFGEGTIFQNEFIYQSGTGGYGTRQFEIKFPYENEERLSVVKKRYEKLPENLKKIIFVKSYGDKEVLIGKVEKIKK